MSKEPSDTHPASASMSTPTWEQIPELLEQWHVARSHLSARRALAFLEVQLRSAMLPAAQRSWTLAEFEDVLRSFLARLLEHPLPRQPEQPKAYFYRAFRNLCIDQHRRRQREQQALSEFGNQEETVSEADPLAEREAAEQVRKIQEAFARLSLADRVALKLVDAPGWLTDTELSWLSVRCGRTMVEITEMLSRSPSVYEATWLFDPDPDPEPGDQGRRLRLERFRRRRGRAREKLRDLLAGEKS